MVIYFRFKDGNLRQQAISWMEENGYEVIEKSVGGVLRTSINEPNKISVSICREESEKQLEVGNITTPEDHNEFVKYMENKKANRATGGKPMLQLLDKRSVIPGIRALEYGLTKYEHNNWKKPMDRMGLLEVVGCLDRHLEKTRQIIDGEREDFFDNDSNVHHVGGVVANALILAYQLTVNMGQPVTSDKPEF